MRRELGRIATRTEAGRFALSARRKYRRAVRVRHAVRQVVHGHLLDEEWYATQSGRTFDSVEQAWRHFFAEGVESGLSPHPLLEPAYLGQGSRKDAADVVLDYLSGPPGRHLPSPYFDEPAYLREHPDAANHPGRAVGHFVEHATDDTTLPLPPGVTVGTLHFGPWRKLMIDSARGWAERQRLTVPRVRDTWDSERERRFVATFGGPSPVDDTPLVSVVMPVWNRPDLVRSAVESVRSQTCSSWELLIVDDGSTDRTPEVIAELAAQDGRLRVLTRPHGGVCAARNAGLAAARGRYVAFLDSDNTWLPRFLELSTNAMVATGRTAAYAGLQLVSGDRVSYRAFEGGRDFLLVGNHIDLNVLVVDRQLLQRVGGFDEGLRRWVDHDLVLRISEHDDIEYLPFLGAVYDLQPGHGDRITATESEGWGQVVLQKHRIDWDRLGRDLVGRVPGRTSILMPTYQDWAMTVAAVDAVLAATPGDDVEVVVLDNGSNRTVAAILDGQLGGRPSVHVLHVPRNTHFAMGSNLAFAASSGDRVVFLNNDTLVTDGWLKPLLEELDDPSVAVAQPLLVYADGLVQCAGVWFPGGGWLPSHLLVDHPAEDATKLGRYPVRALTGAAFAMRSEDVVRWRGFDPMYLNGWEDIDLCMRIRRDRPDARLMVVPDSRVVHLESRTPGRGTFRLANRRLFVQRWASELVSDDNHLWEAAGFQVSGLRRTGRPEVLGVPRPIVTRAPASAQGGRVRLRWSIKIASSSDARGDGWGDTFFAHDLAAALRRLGQDAVVDRRERYHRSTSYLDDVTLTIRGLIPYVPDPGQLNLLWVISHPDEVDVDEVRGFDLVFAASHPWADQMSRRAGVEVEALLQATDPERFHPVGGDPHSGQVLFVGNNRKDRRVVLDAIHAGAVPDVYGGGWSDTDAAPYVRGDFLPNDELGRAYARAGVVLCDHWADMAAQGFVANRVFDAVAAGARVVSDPVVGLEADFGRLVHVYSDADDLRAVLGSGRREAFLPDEERYRRALEFGLANSFDARAQVLLDRVSALRRARGLA